MMRYIDAYPFGLVRSGFAMTVWGVLLILGGVISQWGNLPYPGGFLALWGVITVVGLAVQGLCQVEHQPSNYFVWIGAIGLGWAFTLFVIYVTNFSLFSELAPAWLLLLGLAYLHTGYKIDSRFYTLGIIHLALALIFEIAWRGVVKIDFLVNYTTVIFAVLAGVAVLAAAYYARLHVMARRA